MTGIALLVFILIWGLIAIWLGNLLSKKVFARFTINLTTGKSSKWTGLITILTIVFVFLLPVADEIISYPRYIKLCADTQQYHFAPNMSAKKVLGRKYYVKSEAQQIRLFPEYRILSDGDDMHSGVVVDSRKLQIIDANTEELLLTSKDVRPISSFFALRWDNNKTPWLLRQCTANNYDYLRSLQLKQVYK